MFRLVVISVLFLFSTSAYSENFLGQRSLTEAQMGPKDMPCPGGSCIQLCEYEADATILYGGFEIGGKVNIETYFDNATAAGKTGVRTLVKIQTQGVDARAFMDESSIFDSETLRLAEVFTHIKWAMGGGDRGIKNIEWSKAKFNWPENWIEVPYTKTTIIKAKSIEDLKSKFPGFYKYVPDNKFGANWMEEFDANKPDAAPDRDVKDFSPAVMTPAFASLYHIRYVPFDTKVRYNLFMNVKNWKVQGNAVDLDGEQTNKQDVVLFKGNLAFGEFETQPGKPAKFIVDQKINELKSLELHVLVKSQDVKASAKTTRSRCAIKYVN